LRGEYRIGFTPSIPSFYLGAADNLTHLLGATYGIWRIALNDTLTYYDNAKTGIINTWVRSRANSTESWWRVGNDIISFRNNSLSAVLCPGVMATRKLSLPTTAADLDQWNLSLALARPPDIRATTDSCLRNPFLTVSNIDVVRSASNATTFTAQLTPRINATVASNGSTYRLQPGTPSTLEIVGTNWRVDNSTLPQVSISGPKSIELVAGVAQSVSYKMTISRGADLSSIRIVGPTNAQSLQVVTPALRTPLAAGRDYLITFIIKVANEGNYRLAIGVVDGTDIFDRSISTTTVVLNLSVRSPSGFTISQDLSLFGYTTDVASLAALIIGAALLLTGVVRAIGGEPNRRKS
jgi:hypothetical protein